MIRFALKCPEGHRFESWFRDGDAFAALAEAGRVSCPDCGSTRIEKGLMAPQVRAARDAAAPPPDTGDHPLAPTTARERALAEFRRKVEAEADYVGLGFAREARAIHAGEARERPIYGEARPAEAIELIEDGVPVAPLPFAPTRKVN